MARTVKADDLLIIDVGEPRKQIAARARELEAAEAMVEHNKAILSGEPVFKGTRIPVRGRPKSLAEHGFTLKSAVGAPLPGDPQPSNARAGRCDS